MYVANTDIGRKRENNEDYFMAQKLDQTASVYILADGMGGYESGEVASKSCCLAIMDKIETLYYDFESLNDIQIRNILKSAVKDANNLVYKLEKTDEKYKGMGTTVIVIFVYDKEVYYISIGDSRIYTLDSEMKKLTRVTEDDTYVNELLKKRAINAKEAKNHPQKHILTKAVGVFEDIEIDVKKMEMEDVKYIFAFSDGVTNMLRRSEMLEVFKENEFNNWADKIIEKANFAGGTDNITAIAINIE